jgi:hypothetical protein
MIAQFRALNESQQDDTGAPVQRKSPENAHRQQKYSPELKFAQVNAE